MKKGVAVLTLLSVFLLLSSPIQAKHEDGDNLLENEFFEKWEDDVPKNWTVGAQADQSDSGQGLVSDYALKLGPHTFKGPYEERQKFSHKGGRDQEVTYYAKLKVKGTGYTSVRIREEGGFFWDYGDWYTVDTDEWTEISHEYTTTPEEDDGDPYGEFVIYTTSDNETAENEGGNLKDDVGELEVDLLVGSAWLGTEEPPEDWPVEEDDDDNGEDVEEYILEISVSGGGNTSPSEGEHLYEEGENVELEAESYEGWEFDGWSGNIDSDEEVVEVTIGENKSVMAHFEESEEDEGGKEEVQRININEADKEELTEIINIGEIIAKRIVEDHDEFYTLVQLTEVQDLGAKTVTEIMEEGKAYVVPPEDDWDLSDMFCQETDDEDVEEVELEEVEFMDRSFEVKADDADSFRETIEEVKNDDKIKEDKERAFEIFEYDEKVRAGEKLESLFLVRNKNEESKNFTARSYVYEDKQPVNKESWSGNERKVKLKPGENKSLGFKNRIESETEPGNYSYRIRIEEDERKDFTKEVKVVETGESGENITESQEKDWKEESEQAERTFESPTALQEIFGRFLDFLGL